jgi:hypothetical protein
MFKRTPTHIIAPVSVDPWLGGHDSAAMSEELKCLHRPPNDRDDIGPPPGPSVVSSRLSRLSSQSVYLLFFGFYGGPP